MVFVKEEFPHNKFQKKEHVFGDLSTKITEWKVVGSSMEVCESYKVIEKFGKIYS